MAEIKAADVAKLRAMTGAGMMDCKKALEQSNGDFDAAIDALRKKGQKVAHNRAERTASEGAAIARVSEDGKTGVLVVLNCETDFVATNERFVTLYEEAIKAAFDKKPANLAELKALNASNGHSLESEVMNLTGIIGEKIELSYYEIINAECVVAYIHPGNKLATMAGFNKPVSATLGKDIAMQIAAMAPVALDKDDVPTDIISKEIEIGKEQARNEGKAEEMLEKIAQGRLNKFYQEATLLNQQFIKDSKVSVKQYLQNNDKDLKITVFKRFSLTV